MEPRRPVVHTPATDPPCRRFPRPAGRRSLLTVQLLERASALGDLADALAAARSGRGRVVLLGGGAGIGKTSVVRTFLTGLGDDVAVLEGACDDLLTPRPFGPLHDVARHARRSGLAGALAAEDPAAVFTALLDALADPGGRAATVLVVEDVHWADDASLDALAFATRRVAELPALLLLTYRDDEVPIVAPLRRVLGGLRAPATVRIALPPLSAEAVGRLAGPRGDAPRVHALTGGNPFFVTELLATGDEGLPVSISQAVLARVARLPQPTRELLYLLAVVPARAETALLDAVCPDWTDAVGAAEERGVVEVAGEAVAFRHELARRAVEEALPGSRARQMHGRVLAALRAADGDPARLVHHAERAGEDDALVEVAPAAARAAAAAGAHREATAHYRRALRLAERYDVAQRAELLEAFTVEASTTCRIGEALRAAERALALREEQGDPTGVGRNLHWMSRLAWFAGRREEQERRLTAALDVLETQPPAPDLAMAYSELATRIAFYGGRREEAEATAQRAVALAEECGEPGVLGYVQGRVGMLRAVLYGDNALLCQSLARSREVGQHLEAGVAYQNLAVGATLRRARPEARRWIAEGIEYLEAREIQGPLQYLRGLQAIHELADGDWAGAQETANWVLTQTEGRGITGVYALVATARLQVRRGQVEEAAATLQEAWPVAETCGLLHHVASAATTLAEHAELTGEWAPAVAALRTAGDLAQRLGVSQVVAETGFWLYRAGVPAPAAPRDGDPDDPFTLRTAGRPRAAAAAWRRMGHPYEEAHALADVDDPDLLAAALDV